ncbi:MAG: recombinase family protein [Sphingomonas sp.]|nr:MAG: recombinase family protein [Sphingomonas sp.]
MSYVAKPIYGATVPENLRLLGYARVSTKEQTRYSESLDTQKDALTRWASANGHTLLGIICNDEGESGRLPFARRSDLKDAIARLDRREPGGPQGLLFMRLDRLSRNLLHTIELAERGLQHGWQLVCMQEEIDYATANGRLFLQMRMSMAQYESAQTAERVAYGMTMVRLRARRSQSRRTPFGYRLDAADGPFENAKRARDDRNRKVGLPDSRILVENPAEQRLLARIVKSMASCRPNEVGAGAYRLVKEFRLEGVTHPRGSVWYVASIKNIYLTAIRHRHQRAHYARQGEPDAR